MFLSQKWGKSGQNRVKLENSENWEKIQFFHVSTTLVAQKLYIWCFVEKKMIFENQKNYDFYDFLDKRTRIDHQGPLVAESRQNVKTRHLVWIYGKKSKIWNFDTFDPVLTKKRSGKILKILENCDIFL